MFPPFPSFIQAILYFPASKHTQTHSHRTTTWRCYLYFGSDNVRIERRESSLQCDITFQEYGTKKQKSLENLEQRRCWLEVGGASLGYNLFS